MKNSFFKFLKYNNAVPILLGVILLGAGTTFAATNPEAIYSAQQTVLAPDNTYIATVDLGAYTPQIQITGVTEDDDNYYVAYTLSTIDVTDSVWQDVVKDESMTVSKQDLRGDDLGLYATKQFKNIIANELDYLGQVQAKAKQSITQETVATTYGGLVGKMLTDSTETLPGYTPVVVPVVSDATPVPTPTTIDAMTTNPTQTPIAAPAPIPTPIPNPTTTPDPTLVPDASSTPTTQ